jgi:MFS family permease
VGLKQRLDGVKDFLDRQNHNYRMMLLRSGGANFLMRLTMDYSSYYTKELGASNSVIAYLSSISSFISMIISLPAGWVMDRFNLKHVIGIGMIFQVGMVGMYAFAQNWVWILGAMILNPFTMALIFRSQSIMISNSLRDTDRATGMSLRMIVGQILGLISPIPAAMVIEYFGGISVEGIRPLYYFRLVGTVVLYGYIYWNLLDVEPQTKRGKTKFLEDFGDVLKSNEGLKPFIIVAGGGAIVWSTMQAFTMIWCIDVKGADALTIGYMTTVSIITTIIFAIPMSRIADEHGRKRAFLITRPALWIWMAIIVYAPSPRWLIVGWFFRGLGMSSSAYETLQIELVPADQRGRWLGLVNVFSALVRIPAPILGAYLMESGFPALTFLVPLAVDMLIRTPILQIWVPETLKKPSNG